MHDHIVALSVKSQVIITVEEFMHGTIAMLTYSGLPFFLTGRNSASEDGGGIYAARDNNMSLNVMSHLVVTKRVVMVEESLHRPIDMWTEVPMWSQLCLVHGVTLHFCLVLTLSVQTWP